MTKEDLCILCGRTTESKIVEEVGGRNYVFDRQQCVLLFKKLQKVYGNDFFDDSN